MTSANTAQSAARRSHQLDDVFGALSDPTRRAIVEILLKGEARVTEVARPFPMSLNAISKHIRVLEDGGVVERRIEGRDHILSVNVTALDAAEDWIERMRRFWNSRLDAMEELLRDLNKEKNEPAGKVGDDHGK